ncbi:unnamed protein product [Caenorhabditis auriculariae]|uniref:Uncharacterized protein n=1 Tax=Caenorhabditis auriculariae TaxID=2777116 RepID=A0A8S1H3Y6_9PELO|nr:unnamed protein product [Caenorhabditis auriculariae]
MLAGGRIELVPRTAYAHATCPAPCPASLAFQMETILVGTVEPDRMFAVRLGQQPYRTILLHSKNFPSTNFPICRGDVLKVKVNAYRWVEAILSKCGSFENGTSYFQAEARHMDNVITTCHESIKITDPDGIHTNKSGIFTVCFKDRIDKQNDHLTIFYAVEVGARGEIFRKKVPVVQVTIPIPVSNVDAVGENLEKKLSVAQAPNPDSNGSATIFSHLSSLALVTAADKNRAFMVTLDKKPYRTILALISKIHTPFDLARGQIIDIEYTNEGHVTAVKTLKKTLETVGNSFKVEATYRNGVLYSDYYSFEIEDPKGVGKFNNNVVFRALDTKDAIHSTEFISVDPEKDKKTVDNLPQGVANDNSRLNNRSPINIPKAEEEAPPSYSSLFGEAATRKDPNQDPPVRKQENNKFQPAVPVRNYAGALPKKAPLENQDPPARNRERNNFQTPVVSTKNESEKDQFLEAKDAFNNLDGRAVQTIKNFDAYAYESLRKFFNQ